MIRIGILALAAIALSGCVLFDGSRRSGPDEFGVVTRAPLSQPPDYALRPPRTGAARPNEVAPREEARSQLLNVTAANGDPRYALSSGANGANGLVGAAGAPPQAGLSLGEQALLKQADALNVDPDIRTLVDRESGRVKEDDSLVDKLVFWRKDEPAGKPIDAKKEADRLSRNAALGVPPTEAAPASK
jgi:hypothetical protein